ncbi:hypothetical protein GCM10023144_08850 [Pigmentiphaga soli]|uniref:Diguanylate cyclase n=1 Tax=Pigmentiphaga soli TaxID=1007095 RepID=A0ABP8GKF2_9BURK
MEIFDTVSAHIDAVGLPLYAVTVTAVARADTPVLLMLHWHGFRRETSVRIPGVELPPRAVPGSALQINTRWHAVEALDQALLEAAWRFGAWDVERVERRPCGQLGASAGEALACRQAFGDYDGDDGRHLLSEAPDRGELMQMAAAKGYLRWLFRPRKGGLWDGVPEDDATLAADGGREPPCPVGPRPPRGAGPDPGRTVYRLGRTDHIILPGNQ